MSFLRQYVAPLLIVLIFLVAMVAVSARIFLPNDLAAPAPIEDLNALHRDLIHGVTKPIPADTAPTQFYSVTSTPDHPNAQHG